MKKLKILWDFLKPIRRTIRWNPLIFYPNYINMLVIFSHMVIGYNTHVKNIIILINLILVLYGYLRKLDTINPNIDRMLEEESMFFIKKGDKQYTSYVETFSSTLMSNYGTFETISDNKEDIIKGFRKYCEEKKDFSPVSYINSESEILNIRRIKNIDSVLISTN